MSEFVNAVKAAEVGPGEVRCVELDGRKIAVWNADGTYFATDDACPHAGASLSEGSMDGTIGVCPLHMWRWDLTTGNACDVQGFQVATHATRVEGDDVQVQLAT